MNQHAAGTGCSAGEGAAFCAAACRQEVHQPGAAQSSPRTRLQYPHKVADKRERHLSATDPPALGPWQVDCALALERSCDGARATGFLGCAQCTGVHAPELQLAACTQVS
jgi:hypothetical protein